MLKRTLAAIALLTLAACSPVPSQPSKSGAQNVVEHITYAKDSRTGLCFGVVQVDQTTPYSTGGVSVTNVPCEKVEGQLK